MAEETKIIRIVIDSSKAVDGSAAATRALERMEKAQGDAASSMDRMEKAMGRMGGFMKAQIALLVADMGARLVQMGREAFNAASGMGELAEQLGVTVDGIQALQYSAAQNGVQLAQLETGIGKFSQKIGEAAAGSKEMVESLNAMGVKILDAQGRLRPTETLLTDVARAITGIEDPAKRAAASVDFFGKAGTRFLPMLNDMAGGMDTLTARAKAAGVVMSTDTIEKLDKIADRAAVSSLHIRTLFADLGAPIITTSLERVNGLLAGIADQLARGKASGEGFWATVLNDSRAQGRIGSGPSALRLSTPAEMEADRRAKLESELKDPRNAGRTGMIQEDLDRLNRSRLLDRQAGYESQEDWSRRIKLPGSEALPGASNPPVKGSGDDVADRMRKALQDSGREMEQARAFADAANQGADAVAKLEIHFKALKSAQDVFGKAANDNTKGVAELTAKLEEQALATQKLKNLGDFRAETAAMRDQNELLAAEVRLAGELPSIRERELATLKVMQVVRAKGLSDNKEDIADRIAVMETNEQLKRQGEEIKRSTELWMEPLKTALSSIQTTAADAFEGMLNSGKFNFEELGQVFKKMVIRMAAEFMALATVRPVMSVILNAVSPGMASTFGLSGGTSMPGLGGSGGGFSMPSLPSLGGGDGGGLSGMFGGVGNWLKSPITPTTYNAGYGAAADYASLSGTAMPSGLTSGGQLGGLTWGQGIGSALGIGMGAYQAITSKSLGGTLGGIGTMIGSGMMLIPGMQIPGMIVTALSAILPSIIGEPNTRTHSSTNASLRYGDGNWYTTGGAYGANANSGQSESALRSLTGGIDSVFGLLGGVKDASKVWGLNASSWTAQGKDWSYTSNATHLVDPATGSQEAWRMNMDDMMDTGAAQVAIRSILGGAVGEITSTMTTALKAMSAASMGIKETGESIVFVDEVYERLGKGALTVRSQFRELESQFTEMTATAKRLGLSLAPIEAEQKKAAERLGRDYIDNLIDPIAVGLRAWADEKASILANVDYIGKNTDVIVDMARINEALLRKEATLKEQLYGGAISQLEDAIKRLMPGGNLANIDPAGTLAGLQATYQATYAQASAGDAAAIGRFGGESTAYAEYAQSYFAGSPEYNAIKMQIVEALQTVQAAALGPSVQAGGATTAAAVNANGAQMQQLLGTVNNLIAELQQERQESAKLRAVLSRYVTTQAA